MYECEYCKKKFKSVSNLNLHKKTAKYCLNNREDNKQEEYKCEYCLHIFNRKYVFDRHHTSCKEKNNLLYKELEQEKEKNNLLQKQVELKNNLLQELQKQLDAEIIKNDKLMDSIIDIAKQPTQVVNKNKSNCNKYNTNILNIINSLEPLTTEYLQNLANNITKEIIFEGSGYAYGEMCNNNMLNKSVVCTDTSRGTYIWKNNNKDIIKENNAVSLCKEIFTALEPYNTTLCKELYDYIVKNEENYDAIIVNKKIERILQSKEGIINGSKGYTCDFIDDFKRSIKQALSLKLIKSESELEIE